MRSRPFWPRRLGSTFSFGPRYPAAPWPVAAPRPRKEEEEGQAEEKKEEEKAEGEGGGAGG